MPPVRVALLGDLVDSRDAPDRAALHARFAAALERVNAETTPVVPLAVSVGDECQAVYARLGQAAEAAHRLRLHLLGEVDIRFGLGVGTIVALDAARGLQDGPAWWAARAAIEEVERDADRRGHAVRRTGVAAAQGQRISRALAGALRSLDVAFARLDAVSAGILLGTVGGVRQSEIAAQLDLSPQAVSQRVNRHGLAVLAEALQLIWEEP